MTSDPFFRDQPEPAPNEESSGLGAALMRIILWPFHAVSAQHDRAELDKLSDHELQDIGLSAEEISNVHGATDIELSDGISDERHDRMPRRHEPGGLH